MSERHQSGEVIFRHARVDGFRTIPANGAHGGVTGRGDFYIEFFVEHGTAPEEVRHSVTPDGLGPIVAQSPGKQALLREAQVGVVMGLDQAKSLAHWILDRVRAAEEARKRRE